MCSVSVIVPVYNAERYVENCIRSILRQTFADFELILINDGSTDNSLSILRKFEKTDNRVRVLDKKNCGVSAARNDGIRSASGEYILFVDADDHVKDSMLQKLYDLAQKKNAELVVCGYEVSGSSLIHNDTASLKELETEHSPAGIKRTILKSIISTDNNQIFGYIWRCLFKTSSLIENEIFFPEGIKISEDYMFLLSAIRSMENIVILPEELYIYRVNSSSVTAKYMPTLHRDMAQINSWMYKSICEDYPETQAGYRCCAANTYLRFVQNVCRAGNPYSFWGRIREVYAVKREYRYDQDLRIASACKLPLSRKNRVSYLMLYFNLEIVYICLFRMKLKRNSTDSK